MLVAYSTSVIRPVYPLVSAPSSRSHLRNNKITRFTALIYLRLKSLTVPARAHWLAGLYLIQTAEVKRAIEDYYMTVA